MHLQEQNQVKVREQKEDDLIAFYVHERPLEDFEFLPVHDLSSSAKECEDDSPRSVVRIPKSYTSKSAIPMTPLPKAENKSDNKVKDAEDNKQNVMTPFPKEENKNENKVKDADDSKQCVKATSVLRPRAVLSSPDNDGVIGNRNKVKAELLSGLKNHNMCQNRHTRCKVTPRQSTNENSNTKKGESKEAADSKSELKGRRQTTIADLLIHKKTIADPTQRLHLRKGKPDPNAMHKVHLRKGKPDAEVKL